MTKKPIIKTQFKQLLPQIIFAIIIAVALFLRLFQLEKSVWLQDGYDESRDMLVAEHISIYGEHLYRGPLAAGGMNWLKNSPLYYYFVAIIWFFTREPKIFMYVWALIMTTPVVIGYFIGKKTKDITTGVILASLLAVNYRMISSSRELLQTHLSLIFSIAFIWAIVSYIRNKKDGIKYLLISIIFLFLPLNFHYGVLIALPIGSIFIFYYLFRENQKNKNEVVIGIWTPILIFVSILWFWIILTYRSFPFDQVYFLTKNFKHQYQFSINEQLQNVIATLTKMIWTNSYAGKISAFFLFILIFLIKTKSKLGKSNKEILFFIISMCFSVLFCAFYKYHVAETYLLFVFPFFLVLIALILRLLIERKPIFGWILTLTSILLMLFGTKKIFSDLPTQSFHDQQKEIAQIIYENYLETNLTEKQSPPDLLISWYTTTLNMPFDGWGSSGVWFYLEDKFQQKLVKNTSYGLNHTPINKYPQIIYMICDHRLNEEMIQKECINRFKRSYSIVENSMKKVQDGKYLSLWSALLKNGKIQTNKNVTHLDLMKY